MEIRALQNIHNLESSSLVWQWWSEGESITIIAFQAPPIETPPPQPNTRHTGGKGVPIIVVVCVCEGCLKSAYEVFCCKATVKAIVKQQRWEEEQEMSQTLVISGWTVLAERTPWEVAVPKLSEAFTSERAIPNYPMTPCVSGTPPTPRQQLVCLNEACSSGRSETRGKSKVDSILIWHTKFNNDVKIVQTHQNHWIHFAFISRVVLGSCVKFLSSITSEPSFTYLCPAPRLYNGRTSA